MISSERQTNRRRTANLQNITEDIILHIGVMNPNRAAADFDSVEHKIVMLTSDLK